MKFNINNYVRVRLNDKGREHYLRHWASCGVKDRELPAVDADGFSRFQMWDLMHIFGTLCYLGALVPFDTEIIIEEPKQ